MADSKNAGGKSARLTGMKEISDSMGRSEDSVLRLIREYNFPAKKVLGIWESNRELIEDWQKNMLL